MELDCNLSAVVLGEGEEYILCVPQHDQPFSGLGGEQGGYVQIEQIPMFSARLCGKQMCHLASSAGELITSHASRINRVYHMFYVDFGHLPNQKV